MCPKGSLPSPYFLGGLRGPHNLVGTSNRPAGAHCFTVRTVRAVIGSHNDRAIRSHLDCPARTCFNASPASITSLQVDCRYCPLHMRPPFCQCIILAGQGVSVCDKSRTVDNRPPNRLGPDSFAKRSNPESARKNLSRDHGPGSRHFTTESPQVLLGWVGHSFDLGWRKLESRWIP